MLERNTPHSRTSETKAVMAGLRVVTKQETARDVRPIQLSLVRVPERVFADHAGHVGAQGWRTVLRAHADCEVTTVVL